MLQRQRSAGAYGGGRAITLKEERALGGVLAGLRGLRAPWYHGWTVIAVCLLFQAVTTGIALASFTFFTERWVEDFAVNRSRITLAAVLFSLACTGLGPVLGRVLDTGALRALVAAGLSLFGLGLWLISLATASWHVLAVYAVLVPFGLVLSSTIPAQILAARWFPERTGFAIGLVSLGLPIGGVAFPPLSTFLIAEIGWRATLQAYGAATFALALVCYLVIRNGPARPTPAGQAAAASLPAITVRDIVTGRNFWILGLVMFLLTFGYSGLSYNFASYTTARGLSLQESAGVFTILSLVGFVVTVLCGYLADKVEHRLLFAGSAVLAALGLAGLALAHGIGAVSAMTFLFALGFGGLFVLLGASLTRQYGASALGLAIGLIGIFMALSSTGAPVVAKIHEITQSYNAPLFLLAGLCGLSAVLSLFLVYRKA